MAANQIPQATRSPAEVYEEFFVPALFQEWAERVAGLAGIGPGQRVLDVACGTGVLARAALARALPGGSVVGLDPNGDMLDVARRKSSGIEWRQGRAEALPFDDDSFDDESFDSVVSQFGMMFFEDRHAAIREMMRVLRPDGQLTVAVWGELENSPGYAVLANLLQRLFGQKVGDALRAPYVLSDAQEFGSLFTAAGVHDVKVSTHEGTVRFASIRAMIATERACVFTLGGLLDDDQFELLFREAESALRPFVVADGSVAFPAPAHVAIAAKPR